MPPGTASDPAADWQTSPLLCVRIAIAALIVIRLVAAALRDLGPDEAYRFLWSRHLDRSYYGPAPLPGKFTTGC